MKMKAFFMPSAGLVALLFCCSFNQVQAQELGTSVKYCEAVLPTIQNQLQADADATCTTQTSCVTCTDRASGIMLAATLVVQPKAASCKTATEIKPVRDVMSRGAVETRQPRFTVDIIQSPCFSTGTNLQVYSPGNDLTTREYSIIWEVDGQLKGRGLSLSCVVGKEAKVRVTYLPTNEAVTLSMKLSTAPTETKRN